VSPNSRKDLVWIIHRRRHRHHGRREIFLRRLRRVRSENPKAYSTISTVFSSESYPQHTVELEKLLDRSVIHVPTAEEVHKAMHERKCLRRQARPEGMEMGR
jgi:hypothetical protein